MSAHMGVDWGEPGGDKSVMAIIENGDVIACLDPATIDAEIDAAKRAAEDKQAEVAIAAVALIRRTEYKHGQYLALAEVAEKAIADYRAAAARLAMLERARGMTKGDGDDN